MSKISNFPDRKGKSCFSNGFYTACGKSAHRTSRGEVQIKGRRNEMDSRSLRISVWMRFRA